MVWTATSIVAADVTDRPAPVVARDEVVSELASGSSGSGPLPTVTTSTSITPKVDGPTTTVPAGGRGPALSSPVAPVPAAPPPKALQPSGTIAPAPPATAAPGVPTTRPTSPPPTQPARPTATYSTSGGVVRVACNGFFIELLSAIPSNGYAVDVVSRGPGKVEVHFTRSGQDVSVYAFCYGEPIRYDGSDSSNQGPRSP